MKAVRAGVQHARTPERINVVMTGVGPQRAAEAVTRALSESRIERALVAGVCGLLAAAFLPGDLLLYADVRDAQQNDSLVKTDRTLTAKLSTCLPQAKRGIHALAWPSIVTSSQEKSKLGIRYGADAIDMESHAIMMGLQKAGVQTAVLRVASDGVNDDLPDLNAALDQNGTLNNTKLMREMLRAPYAGMTMAWNGAMALMRLRQAISRITLTQ